MRKVTSLFLSSLLVFGTIARAEVKVTVAHNDGDKANADFKFKDVGAPAKVSAATAAKYEIVDGEKDGASGELDVLHDGKLPSEEDQPDSNFFFNAGTEGGRLSIDLGKIINVKEFRSYSWHPSTRGPQVYTLYASDGTAKEFSAAPKNEVNPEKVGWTLVTKVDTRPKGGAEGGGQYAVSVTNTDGILGKYRYLLMVVSRTESDDDFGNTFFSELNVIDATGDVAPAPGAEKKAAIVKPAAAQPVSMLNLNDFSGAKLA